MIERNVKILDRWYDAVRGVTVIRLSYDPGLGDSVGRRTAKGVAFCSPEDRVRQTKRVGTFHALVHALRECPSDVAHEAFLACIRGGYFGRDLQPVMPLEVKPVPPDYRCSVYSDLTQNIVQAFQPTLMKQRTIEGPTGPHSFKVTG